ncbi:MAG: hypothetical protein HKN13_08965 [Rhodothermales bacterium]|nr:hypothetical protein [Rhodothermales bacterium]
MVPPLPLIDENDRTPASGRLDLPVFFGLNFLSSRRLWFDSGAAAGRLVLILTCALPIYLGCGGTGERSQPSVVASNLPPDAVRVDLEKRNPERLLRFYFDGIVESGSPVWFEENGEYFLDANLLSESGLSGLSDTDRDGVIRWSELEPVVLNSYYESRSIPERIERVREMRGDWYDEVLWFKTSVSGVMTAARREIYVEKRAIRSALEHFERNGSLVYPGSTSFIAEHYDGDMLVETTAMFKRGDMSRWDYAAYDSTGARVSVTRKAPKAYRVPTQCVGCHFGSRAFEPERSYPRDAAPGPHGERVIRAPLVPEYPDLVSLLDEHRRRSDTILGLYATLYLSSLRATGIAELDSLDAAVLTRFEAD